SMTATQELVVPRSMPMILPIVLSFPISYVRRPAGPVLSSCSDSAFRRERPYLCLALGDDHLGMLQDPGLGLVPLLQHLDHVVLRHGVAGLLHQRFVEIGVESLPGGIDLLQAFVRQDFPE